MYTQTGLQVATGEASVASDFKKIADKMKQKGGIDLDPEEGLKKNKENKEEKKTAPLLFFYLILVVVGLVLGLVLPGGMGRVITLLACCGTAIAIVGIQAAIGFPVEQELKKKIAEEKKAGGGVVKLDSEPVIRVAWKFPLYATFL
ncbi:MAG: hypothetical protein L0241_25900, partial [Planctomycetia bacterium]|nr:hypothetical protein [Planctomycetia bacterium]